MKTLCVIPARGGSKGVPNKNIRPLGGRPLLDWTLRAAIRSRWIDYVVVSTDSEKVADVARDCGAPHVHVTGPNLHTDSCVSRYIDIDALEWAYRELGLEPACLCRLHPTSPFRTADHIDEAIEGWNKRGAVVSVTPAPKHPDKCFTRDAHGRLKRFTGAGRGLVPRQDLEPVYAVNGALYLARLDYFRDGYSMWGDQTYGYVMDQRSSWEIDSPFDWEVAEMLADSVDTNRRCVA